MVGLIVGLVVGVVVGMNKDKIVALVKGKEDEAPPAE